jgi:L-lactate dehydrogenase complex protein LldG
MSSRQQILDAIRQNKPQGKPLPDNFAFDFVYEDPLGQFIEVLHAIGGEAVCVERVEAIRDEVIQKFPLRKYVASGLPDLGLGNVTIDAQTTPNQLEQLDLTILPGEFAVAENAAIWLGSDVLEHRVLPFVCQHLVLVIQRSQIISTMHQAYARLRVAAYDYGVFIAGPSKTADIEQSLVIGAHGPRSLTVFILNV